MKYTFLIYVLVLLSNFSIGQNSVFIDAENALNDGEYEKCIQYTSKFIKESVASDTKCVAYLYRGISFYNLQNWKKAKKDLTESLEYKTINDDIWDLKYSAYELLGFTMYYLDDYKQALEYFKQAEKYANYIPAINTTLGYTEMILGNYDNALEYLYKALEEEPDAAYAHSNLAYVFMKLNDLETAMIHANKSIAEDPSNGWAYKHKAMILIEMNKIESACEQLQMAIENNYADFDKKQSKNEVQRLKKKHCN